MDYPVIPKKQILNCTDTLSVLFRLSTDCTTHYLTALKLLAILVTGGTRHGGGPHNPLLKQCSALSSCEVEL